LKVFQFDLILTFNNAAEVSMKVSKNFIVAIKLAPKPAWRLAQEAGVNNTSLSSIIRGATKVEENDPRVLAMARVLGLSAAECFERNGD
jgi:hypothetical protein